MSRVLGLALALLAAAGPAAAADPPERLLPAGSQLYVRWDGVTSHRAAYDASALGGVMKGPTGDTVRTLVARLPKAFGSDLLAEPLLAGRPPEELAAIHKDYKLVTQLPDLILDRGVLVAVDIQEPRLSLDGIGKAVEALVGPGGKPAAAFAPEVQAFLIVPDAGDRADVLFAPTRLFNRSGGRDAATPLPPELKVKGYNWTDPGAGGRVHLGEWVIDGHFVEYAGTVPVPDVIRRMRANAARGGLTKAALFDRSRSLARTGGFTSVARGYVDAVPLITMARKYGAAGVPGLDARLIDLGVGNVGAAVFASGFDGRESRAVYEFDLAGDRKGFAKLLKREPLTLADLPPLPPDCTRFAALRVDVPAAADALLNLVELGTLNEKFGVEEDAKTTAEAVRLRREWLRREADKVTGISIQDDLIANLGDKVVVFNGPTEGLAVFGTVLAVSCKDPAKVKRAVDQAQRAIDGVAGERVKVRKRLYAGAEIRELYNRDFGLLTPTYAVVGDWLVVAWHPQPVQGFVLRAKGDLPRWRPDADTAARLAKLPADRVGLQYCDPRGTVANLTCVGPLLLSLTGRFNRDGDRPDVGLIPNGHELNRHLFPNLTATRDDGKTVRVDVRDSFSLPLEAVGAEPFLFSLLAGAFAF